MAKFGGNGESSSGSSNERLRSFGKNMAGKTKVVSLASSSSPA